MLAILPPGCRTHAGGPNKGLPRLSPTAATAGTAIGQSNPLPRENSVGGLKGIIEKEGALLLSRAPRGPRLNRKGNLANPNLRQPYLRIAPEGGVPLSSSLSPANNYFRTSETLKR